MDRASKISKFPSKPAIKRAPKNDLPMMQTSEGIVLFHPHMPRRAAEYVTDTLSTRWIGQGPKVELFEQKFAEQFNIQTPCISTGSGTDALHLCYLLAGIKPGDEVICPVFTCTATNIPLLYIGATIKFADIDPATMNISVEDVRRKISKKTKAIVVVHYGGLPCDMKELRAIADEYGIPIIEDAAHALGATYDGKFIGTLSEYTMFSFQAIKHLTTGDGGMLTFKNATLADKACRLRWFGIDRSDKQKGIWENDITEIGYKYQLTDIGAAIGLAGLEEFDQTLSYRRQLYARYLHHLKSLDSVRIAEDFNPRKNHAAWLCTIFVERRIELQTKLRAHGIESGQTHYRNDRYSVFNCTDPFPNMDVVDDHYLVLPMHTKMSVQDVDRVCGVIKSGW